MFTLNSAEIDSFRHMFQNADKTPFLMLRDSQWVNTTSIRPLNKPLVDLYPDGLLRYAGYDQSDQRKQDSGSRLLLGFRNAHPVGTSFVQNHCTGNPIGRIQWLLLPSNN